MQHVHVVHLRFYWPLEPVRLLRNILLTDALSRAIAPLSFFFWIGLITTGWVGDRSFFCKIGKVWFPILQILLKLPLNHEWRIAIDYTIVPLF